MQGGPKKSCFRRIFYSHHPDYQGQTAVNMQRSTAKTALESFDAVKNIMRKHFIIVGVSILKVSEINGSRQRA